VYELLHTVLFLVIWSVESYMVVLDTCDKEYVLKLAHRIYKIAMVWQNTSKDLSPTNYTHTKQENI